MDSPDDADSFTHSVRAARRQFCHRLLGHALGFSHAPWDTGYIMASRNFWPGWPGEESSLTRLAYQVGPNVQYPGLVRSDTEIVRSDDRAALMALYDQAGGDGWTNRTNWGTDAPLGSWSGVATGENGRVTVLDLHGNNLKGSMPYEIGGLSELESLNLSDNDLTGPIPAVLGSLTSLQYLDLSQNNLTGEIPPELGDLASLDHLLLSYNNLTGELPPEFGDLSNLGYLTVANNNLTGQLPSSFTTLENLGVLSIQDNDGLCAPSDVAFQRWLVYVSFDGPFCAGEDVDTAPDDVQAAREALMALYEAAGGDSWRRNISWGTDRPLNRWYGVSTDQLGRVLYLDLSNNDLSGRIPPELGNLRHIVKLELHQNDLTGPIPRELGGLTHLEVLDLALNDLTGPIPPDFGDLTNLTWMSLLQNNLTGPIPPTLGALSKLEHLALHVNGLTGPIPPELGSLRNLDHLTLSVNRLTGPIPAELGALTRLRLLILFDNNLTGPVPAEIGAMSGLEVLFLENNNLTGPLPSQMTNLRSLASLVMHNNAGLCAPTDTAFQEWLATVAEFRGETCAAEPVPALPVFALAAAALLLGGVGAGLLGRRRGRC